MGFKDVIIQILWGLAPVFAAGVGYLGKLAAAWIGAHVKNQYLSGALVRLDYAVVNAVKQVEQTMEDAPPDQKKAAAIMAAKAYLGQQGIDVILQVLGVGGGGPGIDAVLGQKVESAVHDLNAKQQATAIKAIPPPPSAAAGSASRSGP